MKKIFLALALVSLWLGLAGCYKYVAEHPEKTDKEFRTDQNLCAQKARDYVQSRLDRYDRRQEIAGNDETAYTRQCMQALGWEYHFRRTGK